jgi:hypothetical protein
MSATATATPTPFTLVKLPNDILHEISKRLNILDHATWIMSSKGIANTDDIKERIAKLVENINHTFIMYKWNHPTDTRGTNEEYIIQLKGFQQHVAICLNSNGEEGVCGKLTKDDGYAEVAVTKYNIMEITQSIHTYIQDAIKFIAKQKNGDEGGGSWALYLSHYQTILANFQTHWLNPLGPAVVEAKGLAVGGGARISRKTLETYTKKVLVAIAKGRNFSKYSQMSKAELITLLMSKKQSVKVKSKKLKVKSKK